MHSSLSNCHYLTKHTDSFTYKRRYNFKNHLPLTIPVCFIENTSRQFFKLEIVVVNSNLPGMTKSVWFINFCYWPRYLYFSVKSVCGIQIYIAIIVRCMIFLYFFSSYLPNLNTILKHTIPIALNNMKIN